jgi:PTH1 family peptidyl-tRNA hydrolase
VHLVVGLGNPGRKYENTRHNAGFLVVDRLAERGGDAVQSKQLGSLVGRAQLAGQPAVLAKPQGYMNRSGQPVASLRGYYKIDPDKLIVVHDEVDLPFGRVRVKTGGGHGGHNGLRDLHQAVGKDFTRVRVGVGRPPEGWDTADYVLGRWTSAEAESLEEVVDLAADAVEAVIRDGALAAMNVYNTRSDRGSADSGVADGAGSPGRESDR